MESLQTTSSFNQPHQPSNIILQYIPWVVPHAPSNPVTTRIVRCFQQGMGPNLKLHLPLLHPGRGGTTQSIPIFPFIMATLLGKTRDVLAVKTFSWGNHIRQIPLPQLNSKGAFFFGNKGTNSPIRCMCWNYPPPSNSHHQDYYIFNMESQPKPSFVTGILGGG